jgi:hypothetical protein
MLLAVQIHVVDVCSSYILTWDSKFKYAYWSRWRTQYSEFRQNCNMNVWNFWSHFMTWSSRIIVWYDRLSEFFLDKDNSNIDDCWCVFTKKSLIGFYITCVVLMILSSMSKRHMNTYNHFKMEIWVKPNCA